MFSLSKNDIQLVQKYVESHFLNIHEVCYILDGVKAVNDQHKILIADNLRPLEVLNLLMSENVRCVIQNSFQSLMDKLVIVSKAHAQKSLFFDASFSFVDGDIMIQKFTATEDRTSMLENFFLFNNLDLEMVKNQKLYQVTQELIMNAQIDAPKYSAKKESKVSTVIIEKNESSHLVAISVIDEYGSLDIRKMLHKIHSAHSQGFRESMSEIGHGAGLGSAMLYQFVDSLAIGCRPNEKTRVTAIMPLGVSEKKIDSIQKSICIIEE